MRKNLKLKLFLLTFLYNSPLFSMDRPDLGEPEPTPKSKSLNKPAKNLQDKATIEKLLEFHLESRDRDFEGIIEKTEDLEKAILKIKKSRLNQHIFLLRVNANTADSKREKANYLAGIQISKNQEECLIHYIDPTGTSIPQKINSLFQEHFNNKVEEPFNVNKIQISGQTDEDQAVFLAYLFKLLKQNKPCPEIQNLSKFMECLRNIYRLELQVPDLSYKPEPSDIKNLAMKFALLGHSYVEMGDATKDVRYYNEATLFYNYVIAMLKDNDFLIKEIKPYGMLNSIQSKLVEAIAGDQTKLKQIITPEDHIRVSRQNDLTELRINVKNKIKSIENQEDSIEASKQLFQDITARMRAYLANLYKDAEKVVGDAPCDYALIGLGSMPLQQMTPYSDLEFAILASDETHEDYFKKLTELVHFWVINLGETVIPRDKYGCDLDHFVKQGVNFDLGGKTPLGRFEGYKPYKLICTIDQMLWYMRNDEQKSEHIDKNLPYILQKTCFIHGNQNLFDKYNGEVKDFLKEYGESRAVKVLKDGCCEIDYTNYSRKESKMLGNIQQFKFDPLNASGRKFNIKEEIYRLPDRFIYNLGLIYGIDAENSWDTLTQLAKEERIIKAAETNLKKALTFATLLRLKVYSHYDYQKETMDWEEENDENLTQTKKEILIKQNIVKSFNLKSNDLEEDGAFFEYYYVTIPLTWKLAEFCLQKPEKSVFFKEDPFYDDSICVKADINLRLDIIGQSLRYQKLALQELKNRYEEDSSQFIQKYVSIASTYYLFGDYANAIQHYEALLKRETSDENLCNIYIMLGKSWSHQGDRQKGWEYFQKSLEKQRENELFSETNPSELLIYTYNRLGANLSHQCNFEESSEYLEKSLSLSAQKFGQHHPLTAECYNDYSVVLLNLGRRKEALYYLKKSLKIRKKIFYKNYRMNAGNYYDIGEVYRRDNLPDKALKNFQKALKIGEKALGIEHPDNAPIYDKVALAHSDRGKLTAALHYCAKGLKSREKLGQSHPDIAYSYLTRAQILSNSMKYQEALDDFQKALDVMEGKLDKGHPDITEAYRLMGDIYSKQKNYEESLACFKKELENIETQWGKDHYTTANTHNSIARTLFFQEKYKDALVSCAKVFKIKMKEKNLANEIKDSYVLMAKMFEALRYNSKTDALFAAVDNNENYVYLREWGEPDDKTASILVTIAPKLDEISQHIQEGHRTINNKIGNLCKKYEDTNDQEIVKMLCFEAICLGLADGRLNWTKSLDCLKQFCRENLTLVIKIAKLHPEYFVKKEIVSKCIRCFPQELKELDLLLPDSKLTVQIEKPATKAQQNPQNTAPAGRSFEGQGKEEIPTAVIKKYEERAKGYPHKQPNTILTAEKPTTSVLHHATRSNIQDKSEQYISQRNVYTVVAVQHAEDGNAELAARLAEEADKKFQEAEDAELATKLQQSEFSGSRLQ